MVAAAAEAVVTPHLADVETDLQPVGKAVEVARDVAPGGVILASEATLLQGERLVPLPARAFGKDADMGGIARTVRAATVADDVVVQIGDDVPALRLGVIGQHLAAVEALLLA